MRAVGAAPFAVESGDDAIAREVWEHDVYGLRRDPPPPDAVVVDVGAHVGCFAAFAATLCPTGQVLAAEMHAPNYARLVRHLAPFAHARAVQCAVVGDCPPAGYVVHPANTGMHALVGLAEVPGIVVALAVTRTLDALLREYAVRRVDLLKLDIEGAEYAVLRTAARDGVLGRVRRIVGEWHAQPGESTATLAAILAPWFDVRLSRATIAEGRAGWFYADRH